MKKLCAILVFTLVSVEVMADDDRVNLEASYSGGGFNVIFKYPKKPGLRSGKNHEANGVDVSVTVALSELFSVGYRHQENFLRKPRFLLSEKNSSGLPDIPDPNQVDGSSRYQEIFGIFSLPKTRRQNLIVGIARIDFDRTWEWPDNTRFEREVLALGLVIGLSGQQRLGRLVFDYSGRLMPRLTGQDRQFSENFPELEEGRTSFGFEVRSTITYQFSQYVGLTGGYQYRRIKTDFPSPLWPINEKMTNSGLLVGLRFSF